MQLKLRKVSLERTLPEMEKTLDRIYGIYRYDGLAYASLTADLILPDRNYKVCLKPEGGVEIMHDNGRSSGFVRYRRWGDWMPEDETK